MPEPTVAERRQFLILVCLTISVNMFAACFPSSTSGVENFVPEGKLIAEARYDEKGRLWGEPIIETGPYAVSKIILNEADRSALLAIPGIGPRTADRIIAARADGPFLSWEDLERRVPKLSKTIIKQMQSAGIRLNR